MKIYSLELTIISLLWIASVLTLIFFLFVARKNNKKNNILKRIAPIMIFGSIVVFLMIGILTCIFL